MLKPLHQTQELSQAEIQRTCEMCGTPVPSSYALNFILIIGSPGHPSLTPIQCTQTEHWACSIEHWEKVAHACITEHGLLLLQEAHSNVSNSHQV